MGQNTSGLKSWFVVTDYFPNDPTQAGNASTSQTNTPAPGGNAIAGQGSSAAGRNASLRRFEDPFGVGPVTIKKLNDHLGSGHNTTTGMEHRHFTEQDRDNIIKDVDEKFRAYYDHNHPVRQNGNQPADMESRWTIRDMERHIGTLIDDEDEIQSPVLNQAYFTLYHRHDFPAYDSVLIFVKAWRAACHLKMLRRFLDEGQPRLVSKEVSPPAGESLWVSDNNLDSNTTLCHEWQVKRNLMWLRHRPGLVEESSREGGVNGLKPFTEIYSIGRFLLEAELTATGERYQFNAEDENCKDVLWIQDSGSIIREALDRVFDIPSNPVPRSSGFAALNPSATPPPPLTQAQKGAVCELNLSNVEDCITIAKLMADRWQQEMAVRPFELLICDLINLECDFETALSETHVEDKLFEKQFSLLDEGTVTRFGGVKDLWHGDAFFVERVEKILRKQLRNNGLINLQRRNYRLFRDWNELRPWKNCWQLYDSRPITNRWLRTAIPEFLDNVRVPGLGEGVNATAYANVLWKLFNFIPRDVGFGPAYDNRIFAGQCYLCSKGFRGNEGFDSTAMQCHCEADELTGTVHDKSFFHMKCLSRYWDSENVNKQVCPICRHHPKSWHRKDQELKCDIAFKKNVFSWHAKRELDRTGLPVLDVNYLNIPRNVGEQGKNETVLRQYWRAEIEKCRSILEASSTFPWFTDMNFAPGVAREDSGINPIGGVPLTSPAQRRQIHGMVSDYIDRTYPDLPDAQRDAMSLSEDLGQAQTIKRTRFPPQMEVSWLRHLRRQRNRKRREYERAKHLGVQWQGPKPGRF